jgi:hypothetical protein
MSSLPGQDVSGGQRIAATDVLGAPAGLAHQQDAGRDVPGCRPRQPALPIAVHPSGRNPGEVEGCRTEAAQPRDLGLQPGNLPAEQRRIAATEMRECRM